MMKNLLLTLLTVMVSVTMNAEHISKQKALQKARQFMPGKCFTVANSRSMARGSVSQTDEAELYILNADDGGFVIVSGDDRTVPILGYSDQGEFRTDDMPDNVRSWLESYVEQIKALDHGATPVVKAGNGPAEPAIEPLIKTQWNQTPPYNIMCPVFDKVYSMTGCVATALAQVMYYHRCPENSSTAIPAYTTATRGKRMPELPAVTFKWDLMKESYSRTESGEAVDAVAELMLYAGQAVQMDYNAGGSGASLDNKAMSNYFGFSKNMYFASREYYSVSQWENMIYQELEERRPVIYSGFSASSGHEFICDGYDGNGLFHINWGWGGSSNGYFVLSLANSSMKGAGGGSGTDGYAIYQRALIGCQPAGESESERPRLYPGVMESFSAEYARTSTDQDFENVTLNFPIRAAYSYVPTTTCTVNVGWALCKDGQLLSVLSSSFVEIDNRSTNPNYTKPYKMTSTVAFGAGLEDGLYTLEQVYKPEGDSDWRFCINPAGYYLTATITGTSLTLKAADSDNATFTVNGATCSGDMGIGDEISVAINLTNTSDVMQESIYLWTEKNGTLQKIGWGYGSIEPGKTGVANLVFTPTFAGTYDVLVSADIEGKKMMGSFSVTIYESEEITVDNIVYKCNTGTGNATVIGDTFPYTPDILVDLVIPAQVVSDKTSRTYQVKKIADRAMNDIYWFKSLTIEEGIEEIGYAAFSTCLDMETLDLPSTLKTIGYRAFSTCNYMKTLICRMAEPCSIDDEMFEVIWSVNGEAQVSFPKATLYVPVGSRDAYANAPVWKDFAPIYQGEPKELTLDGITYTCITGDKIAIVTKGDSQELNGKDVVIPSAIMDDATNTSYLVKTIADAAFLYVYLNSLTIESGIEEIGINAFRNEKLTRIELPATLTTIGEGAFANNSLLETVVVHSETPCSISRDVFTIYNKVGDETVETFTNAILYVPEGSKAAYSETAVWKDFSAIYQGELMEWTTDDGITYAYVTGEDYATVVKGDKTKLNYKDVTILSQFEIDGRTWHVKSISAKAFSSISLRSLVIEPGIEEIRDQAFYNCWGLYNVVIPESVKSIGEKAFYSASLRTLELPSTLTSIGEKAFSMNSLNTVVVHMETPFSINENVFLTEKEENGQWTTIFTPAALYVPIGLKEVYAETPAWSKFSTIYQGELKELTTDDGFTFSYITGEDIATLVKGDKSVLNGKDVVIPSQIEIDGRMRYVKAISKNAFQYFNFKSLVIEPGIETIENQAFWNANSTYWEDLVIPEGVTTIGQGAFNACYSLKNVDLPSTLTTIGDNAFGSDNRIVCVVARMEEPPTISEGVFAESIFGTASLCVPADSKEAYANDPVWGRFSTIYRGTQEKLVQDGITYQYITGEDFATVVKSDKDVLQNQDVTILSTITVDGKNYAVKSIANKTFYSISMKSLTIEPGIEEIGNEAFKYSSMGGTIVIPEGVKTIGGDAFYYCSLNQIELSSTLTAIGDNAFANNYNLATVIAHMEEPCTLSENAFVYSKWLDGESVKVFTDAMLFVPSGSKAAYMNAPVWQNFSSVIVLGDADGDGVVDQKDINALDDHIMGNTPDGFDDVGADANLDGEINAADIVTIVNMIDE